MNNSAGIGQSDQTSDAPHLHRVVRGRSLPEIRVDILRAILEGAQRSTDIMEKTDLSWVPLLDNLTSLSIGGFLSQETASKRKTYSVTKKGIEMVRARLSQLREALPASTTGIDVGVGASLL